VDLANFRENARGRRVFMDFNPNLQPIPGDQDFSLDRLDGDVADYLRNAGADQHLPIARLRHMNPLAIELYKRYKVDITAEPLEFAVHNQHMNGGIAVDIWGRTNLAGIYAVGEAAGTHGVTRPGGSALNAGQVFGTRVAEHMGASGVVEQAATRDLSEAATLAVAQIEQQLQPDSPHDVKSTRAAIQARMSDHAGILCNASDVATALGEAQDLRRNLSRHGLSYTRPSEAARVLQWHQMALASEAVLTALDHYITQGGGSRGARAICDPDGDCLPHWVLGPLENLRFRGERDIDKDTQLIVHLAGGTIQVSSRPNRPFDEGAKSFFERDWPAWLTGEIYDLDQGDSP
jgi:hypothetical protein